MRFPEKTSRSFFIKVAAPVAVFLLVDYPSTYLPSLPTRIVISYHKVQVTLPSKPHHIREYISLRIIVSLSGIYIMAGYRESPTSAHVPIISTHKYGPTVKESLQLDRILFGLLQI